MPLPRLEVFATPKGPDREVVVTDRNAVEESRAAAWEQGYRAGRDDAEAALARSGEQTRAELERNLMTLAFTWQEARAHILGAMEPLLTTMVSQLLPRLARETLAPVIAGELLPMLAEAADQPAVLTLNPAARPEVETFLSRSPGLRFDIREDSSLAGAEVFLRLGVREVSIDLTRVTEEIITAVQDFFTLSQETPDG